MSTPPAPPDWVVQLIGAARDDPEWFDRVIKAVNDMKDARRVRGEARQAEQAAAQRRLQAEETVDTHTATLRDILIEKGGP